MTADPESNRPFGASHSRGTKPPRWRAKIALGQDKQRRLPFKIIHAFCLFSAGETFALQHRGFVPRNGQLQRAYYRTVRIFKLFLQP